MGRLGAARPVLRGELVDAKRFGDRGKDRRGSLSWIGRILSGRSEHTKSGPERWLQDGAGDKRPLGREERVFSARHLRDRIVRSCTGSSAGKGMNEMTSLDRDICANGADVDEMLDELERPTPLP